MQILAIFTFVFLVLRTFISLVNLISRLHLPEQKPASFLKVSVLIPARNEEAVIGCLLESLKKQDYPDFEVIICNDHSWDNTEEILNWMVGEDERFHWFLGEKLPADWLGKNYACHQLAQKASGRYLIFLDADVELYTNAISKAVALFQEKELSLLSVFPQQKMGTFAEQITVPVMNWILQSLLPMIFGSENQIRITFGGQWATDDVRRRKLPRSPMAFPSQESKCGRYPSGANDQSRRIKNSCSPGQKRCLLQNVPKF
jgi:chlorobactene glucosyltransferase